MTALVELKGISKSFIGVRVLNNVDFDVRPGEVHALLGENGAGKSTLIKIIAGVHAPDAGDIVINGEPVKFANPGQAVKAGIAIVYQELLLFPELSVAENIFLNHAPRSKWGGARLGADARARASAPRRSRFASPRCRCQGRHALGRQPPARRDRQGVVAERPRRDHGRADRVARRSRCAAIDGHHPASARQRRRHRLCQPQIAGDLRAGRPGNGAARRQAMSARSPSARSPSAHSLQ